MIYVWTKIGRCPLVFHIFLTACVTVSVMGEARGAKVVQVGCCGGAGLFETPTIHYLHRAGAHTRDILHDCRYTVITHDPNTKVVYFLIVIIYYIRFLLAIAPRRNAQTLTLPPSQNPPIHRRPQMGW